MSTTDRPRVLVAGATGYIGGRLVPRLRQMGYPVACLARHPYRLAERWPGVEVISGDVLDEASLAPALQDVHTAYYLIHSMRAGEAGLADRDRQAAHNFATAARAAGVRHIIYLGGLGDGQLSPHLASRQESGRKLGTTGIPVTEFRAAVIVGSGSISFELIRSLVERLPMMVCPRWVRTRCQPIGVDDVLRYLSECPSVPAVHGRVVEIGGADVLTYGDMMLQYAAARGLRRRLLDVPLMTPRLSSYWCDLVTPIPASLARPLIEGMRTEVTVKDDEAARQFDFWPIGYREAVDRALDRRTGGPDTVWSGSLASVARRKAPPLKLESSEGLIREMRTLTVAADPADLFEVLAGVGGRRGWLYATWIWRLRGALDRLVGGVGFRRGRRDSDRLRAGDAVDFWRVEDIKPQQRLLLRAEMKVPGRAWLEWVVEPVKDGRTQITQAALFEPRGLAGLAYWWALYPVHGLIFGGMLRAIARRALDCAARLDAEPAHQPSA